MSTDAEQAPGGGSGRRIRIPQAPPPEPPPVDESVDEADIEQETAPVEQEPAQAGREREAAAEREREETAEREREAAAKRQREEAKREREEAKRQRAEEAKREREEAKRKRSEPRAKRRAELPAQVYKDERPAEEFAAYHERVRAGGPEWIYDVVRLGVTLVALIVFRARAYGSDNVPNGPVILAPNHGSFFDHFLTGAFVRRHVQFMAKSHMFQKRRLSTWIYTHGGVFPVRRGSRDEEAMLTARKVLERGGCLGMYVEGGRTRSGEIADEAKPGMGRLALETGVPVVPVAIIGSHRIRDWKHGHFPKVAVHYGKPLAFTRIDEASRGQQQAASDEILRRIRDLHGAKARGREQS